MLAQPGEGESHGPPTPLTPHFAGSPWHGGGGSRGYSPPCLPFSVIENQQTLTTLTRADMRMLRDLRSL